ncbi:hypothetical protein [Vibrio diabolicus]|uniref:hypothetical protein n=1 Tax=Vibrio diabolicus TaxID=50719 RepID=UPI0022A877B6|nr:hypothetical protein [Vibrio diabolicus]MCZ0925387.1 hypothetical protein [Vibrio diabolicus]
MKKTREFRSNYLLFIAFLMCLLLILFGTLIGSTSFQGTFINVAWYDALSAVGSILAGGGTCFAAFYAYKALSTWERQWKFTTSHRKTDELLSALKNYQSATLDIAEANLKNTEFSLGEESKLEQKIDVSDMHNSWFKFNSQLYDVLGYVKGKKLLSTSKIEELRDLVSEVERLAWRSKQQSTDLDFEATYTEIQNRSYKANYKFTSKVTELKLWLYENQT